MLDKTVIKEKNMNKINIIIVIKLVMLLWAWFAKKNLNI